MKRAIVPAVVLAAAAGVITFSLGEHDAGRWIAPDVYWHFYPNALYAIRSVVDGGRGVWWNPFQNCGQPFFGTTTTGLAYPANVLFLLLDPGTALRGVLFVNLAVGGLGMVGLLRELGAGRTGALAGGLAMMLGPTAAHATTWTPTVQGPVMWMPAAMWACERLLRAPDLRRAVVLGLCLAAALLPGHPQFVLFTAELIVLRLLWGALVPAERPRLAVAAAAVAVAALVAILVDAVALLPGLEVAAESVRRAPLAANEIEPLGAISLARLAAQLATHHVMAPAAIVPTVLALGALGRRRARLAALFYLLAGVVFFLVALGQETALGRLHLASPLGTMFRQPSRMLVVVGFCIALLAGLSVDALARGSWRATVAVVVGAAVLRLALGPLAGTDWMLVGIAAGGGALAAIASRARPLASAALVAAIGLGPMVTPYVAMLRLLPDDAPLRVHEPLFSRVRARLTPQDRVHLAVGPRQPDFVDKTATVFALPAIADYEPQTSRRWAEFLTKLRTGDTLRSLNQFYYAPPWAPGATRWPLVDLAAVRFVLVHADVDRPKQTPLERIDGDAAIHVYLNRHALPRAYYVPQAEVVEDGAARLGLLAARGRDPRTVALLDVAPRSGFLGEPGNGLQADARIEVDEPERVVLQTDAPAHGFVFLADPYFPGWSATVNGIDVPVLAANHAFRLVEVPSGPVTVELRYRPRLVWIGAGVSVVALGAIAMVLFPRRAVTRAGPAAGGTTSAA